MGKLFSKGKNWIKSKIKLLFVDGWLLWLFLCWPGLVIGISYLLWGLSVQTWHATAYAIQLGAFVIFLVRLNILYSQYDPNKKNIFQAICSWMRRFINQESKITVGASMINDPESINAYGSIGPPKNPSTGELIQWVENRFRLIYEEFNLKYENLNEEIDKLNSALTKRIKLIVKQLNDKQIAERKIQLPNLGREVVAVLWLLSAATIFAITNLAG